MYALSRPPAAPPMVLDGSGKEGIHVDTMQEEAQQTQQVTGEAQRERERETVNMHAQTSSG